MATSAPDASNTRIAARWALPPKINQLPAQPATPAPPLAHRRADHQRKGKEATAIGAIAIAPARCR